MEVVIPRKWKVNITNPAAVEWLESLDDIKHMTLFRPLGGSCANSETGGTTALARIYRDHSPHNSLDSVCDLCIDAGELIIVE